MPKLERRQIYADSDRHRHRLMIRITLLLVVLAAVVFAAFHYLPRVLPQ